MKIQIVCSDSPSHGGAATSFYYVNELLNKKGHQSKIIFTGSNPSVKGLDCNVDVFIAKNHYGLKHLVTNHALNKPIVFVTSGIGSMYVFARKNISYVRVRDVLTETSDVVKKNIHKANLIVPNSELLKPIYERTFPNCKFSNIFLGALASCIPIKRDPLSWKDRDINIMMVSSDWTRSVKNPVLASKIAIRYARVGVLCIGAYSGRIGTNNKPILSHLQFLELLARTKVLVIPSYYDSSPGILFEAIRLGANVVSSMNVGDHGFLPKELIAKDCDFEQFVGKIDFALTNPITDPKSVSDEVIDKEINKFVGILKTVI